jgi:hypothetical protein
MLKNIKDNAGNDYFGYDILNSSVLQQIISLNPTVNCIPRDLYERTVHFARKL